MNKARNTLTNIRAMPLVFRASIALLVMAGAVGQMTQHRAAGPKSAGLLIAAGRACPMAVATMARLDLTVGDTERAVDRALRWVISDQIRPQQPSRCFGSQMSETV